MTKPDSIVLFDRLFLGTLALSLLNFIVGWEELSAKLARTPEFAASGFGNGFIVATFAGGMIINLIIWYFVSARASKIAKWILTVLFAFGLISMLRNFNDPLGPQGLTLGMALIVTIIQAAAIYMLFRPDSIAWFSRKPPVDPDTFR